MENNIDKKGFTNRKIDGLPKKKTKIEIIVPSKTNGEEIYRCSWKPCNENKYPTNDQPLKGYLGTATITSGKYEGIGFHAWEQNDSEFIYYKILKLILFLKYLQNFQTKLVGIVNIGNDTKKAVQ